MKKIKLTDIKCKKKKFYSYKEISQYWLYFLLKKNFFCLFLIFSKIFLTKSYQSIWERKLATITLQAYTYTYWIFVFFINDVYILQNTINFSHWSLRLSL